MANTYSSISKKETYGLIKQAQEGDSYAREILIEKNAGLVNKIAWKFANSGVEIEDLIQIGYIGLLKAINKFDFRYNVMFSTYAVPLILGEIKGSFREGGQLKVSRSLKTEISEMNKIKDRLIEKLGRSPKISELAKEMKITTEHLIELLETEKELSDVVSFESLETDFITKQKVCDPLEKDIDYLVLKEEIKLLEKKEKEILLLRYFKDLTQSETGKILGMSQVQVSRIEKMAIKHIREKMTK